ncbi:MAG: hypothetical protein IBX57_01015 [Gammaproteobacteria bacterium]|nr:hypothetical protein [Gammaproteobacteria bacterium]
MFKVSAAIILSLFLSGCISSNIVIVVTDKETKTMLDGSRKEDKVTGEKNENQSVAVDRVNNLNDVTIPNRPPLPPLPKFSSADRNNPELIENILVDYIIELRAHISDFYEDVEICEREFREQKGLNW